MFSKILPTISLIVALLALAGNSSAADTKSENLVFGIYSNDRPSTLVRQFRPILKGLERRMEDRLGHNVTIRISITKTYQDAVELLADGTFDFARFGPVSYVNTKKVKPDVQLVAMELVEGEKVFYGIVAVNERDRDTITTIEDLKGKSFAFGDQQSTIGRFLSQQFLMENGILAADLETYEYLGRHDKVGEAVGKGTFDAGALKESTFKKLQESGVDIVELARFPNVTKPWIANSDMSPRLVAVMRDSLLDMDGQSKALGELKIDGFTTSEDSDYDVIRRAIDENDKFFEEK